LATSRELGVDPGLPASLDSTCSRAIQAGDAKSDFAALHKIIGKA